MSGFEAFNLIAETLWWGFWLGAVAILLGLSAWNHRPWRKRRAPLSERMVEVYGRVRRRMEKDDLAKMEAEAGPLWRPDRERVRELTGRKS